MPANNTKRFLTRLKLLRTELQKFKGKAAQVALSKLVIQLLDRVEEHRDLTAIEISHRIRFKIQVRNLTSILEVK
jgi:hypothetical protein